MSSAPLSDALTREIVALYREARGAVSPNFKCWAMARARQLLPLHSTHWISGVMTAQGPVFHDVHTEGMRAGYWEHYLSLMDIDPLGPRMFANPGTSFLVDYESVPPRIRDEIMRAFDVRSAVQGMSADPTTGTFSVVCWHRDPTMPEFGEDERRLHEQLLPHWVECLHLHRVGRVLRDLDAAAMPGAVVALVESTGLIHYAQIGFGELMNEEFPDWPGISLPAALRELHANGAPGYEGASIDVGWRPAGQQLWLVHARHRRGSTRERSREIEVRLLNATLDERERELEETRQALHEREKREAVQQERQRILRELHDGVGAHLVGLRSLMRPGGRVTEDMSAALEQALDEMRLAVDSMQAPESDLCEVLATLRWRMQPRMEAAGVQLEWSMPESAVVAAASARLGAHGVLQVQRVLLEALANVLKHARASVVQVSLESRPNASSGWELRVQDDGVGPPAAGAPNGGVGLGSMALRAAAIGAALDVRPASASEVRRGTVLRLTWPAPTHAAP